MMPATAYECSSCGRPCNEQPCENLYHRTLFANAQRPEGGGSNSAHSMNLGTNAEHEAELLEADYDAIEKARDILTRRYPDDHIVAARLQDALDDLAEQRVRDAMREGAR